MHGIVDIVITRAGDRGRSPLQGFIQSGVCAVYYYCVNRKVLKKSDNIMEHSLARMPPVIWVEWL